jgi:hypothetical protein
MMGFAMDVVGKTYTNFLWTARFSLVGYIKRFSEYFIDTSSIPSPLQPDKLFFLEEIQIERRNG